ncbi:Protein of unknown function [Gryllus bimaculatus]|nr:Protein of unknown function [Gryllus bimaculatus]
MLVCVDQNHVDHIEQVFVILFLLGKASNHTLQQKAGSEKAQSEPNVCQILPLAASFPATFSISLPSLVSFAVVTFVVEVSEVDALPQVLLLAVLLHVVPEEFEVAAEAKVHCHHHLQTHNRNQEVFYRILPGNINIVKLIPKLQGKSTSFECVANSAIPDLFLDAPQDLVVSVEFAANAANVEGRDGGATSARLVQLSEQPCNIHH